MVTRFHLPRDASSGASRLVEQTKISRRLQVAASISWSGSSLSIFLTRTRWPEWPSQDLRLTHGPVPASCPLRWRPGPARGQEMPAAEMASAVTLSRLQSRPCYLLALGPRAQYLVPRCLDFLSDVTGTIRAPWYSSVGAGVTKCPRLGGFSTSTPEARASTCKPGECGTV